MNIGPAAFLKKKEKARSIIILRKDGGNPLFCGPTLEIQIQAPKEDQNLSLAEQENLNNITQNLKSISHALQLEIGSPCTFQPLIGTGSDVDHIVQRREPISPFSVTRIQ